MERISVILKDSTVERFGQIFGNSKSKNYEIIYVDYAISEALKII